LQKDKLKVRNENLVLVQAHRQSPYMIWLMTVSPYVRAHGCVNCEEKKTTGRFHQLLHQRIPLMLADRY